MHRQARSVGLRSSSTVKRRISSFLSWLGVCALASNSGCELIAEPTYRRFAPETPIAPAIDVPSDFDATEGPDEGVVFPDVPVVIPDAGPPQPATNRCSIRGEEVCNGIDDDCDEMIDNNARDVGRQCTTDTGQLGVRKPNCTCEPNESNFEICYDGFDQPEVPNTPDACRCTIYYRPGAPPNSTIALPGGMTAPLEGTAANVRQRLIGLRAPRPVVCLMTATQVQNVCAPMSRPFTDPITIMGNEQWVGGFRDDGTFVNRDDCRPTIAAMVTFDSMTEPSAALVNVNIMKSSNVVPSPYALRMDGQGVFSNSSIQFSPTMGPAYAVGSDNVGVGTRIIRNASINATSTSDVAGIRLRGGTVLIHQLTVGVSGPLAVGVALSQTQEASLTNITLGAMLGVNSAVGILVGDPRGPTTITNVHQPEGTVSTAIGGARASSVGLSAICRTGVQSVNVRGMEWRGSRAVNALGITNDRCSMSLVGTRALPLTISGAAGEASASSAVSCLTGTCIVDGAELQGGTGVSRVVDLVTAFVGPEASVRLSNSRIFPQALATHSSGAIVCNGSFYGDRLIVEPSRADALVEAPTGVFISGSPMAELVNSTVRVERGLAVLLAADQVVAGTFGILMHSNTFYQIAAARNNVAVMIGALGVRAPGASIRFLNNIVAPTYDGTSLLAHLGFCVANPGIFSAFDHNLVSGGQAIFATGPMCADVQPDNVAGALTFLGPPGGMLFRGNAALERDHHINPSSAAHGFGVVRMVEGDKDIDVDDRPNGRPDIGADEIP